MEVIVRRNKTSMSLQAGEVPNGRLLQQSLDGQQPPLDPAFCWSPKTRTNAAICTAAINPVDALCTACLGTRGGATS
jgi:hypothetical protein